MDGFCLPQQYSVLISAFFEQRVFFRRLSFLMTNPLLLAKRGHGMKGKQIEIESDATLAEMYDDYKRGRKQMQVNLWAKVALKCKQSQLEVKPVVMVQKSKETNLQVRKPNQETISHISTNCQR